MAERKLGALLSVNRTEATTAPAEHSTDVAGYARRGVPPVGHRTRLPIYIDDTLTGYKTPYAAGGTADIMARAFGLASARHLFIDADTLEAREAHPHQLARRAAATTLAPTPELRALSPPGTAQ